MRIAFIRNSYSGDFGGAEIIPVRLANALNQNGAESILLSANKKTIEYASASGVHALRSPWWAFQNFSGFRLALLPLYIAWQMFLVVWYLVFFVRRRIDVINPQSRDDFLAATIAGRLLGKRIIWTDHADLKNIYLNHRIFYKNPIGKLVWLASKLSHCIVIESQSEKRIIEEVTGSDLPARYQVYYLGVQDTFKSRPRNNTDFIDLVTTSRLVKDKGIAEVIEAMQYIKNTNVRLNICGTGPDGDYFKKLARGDKRIMFHGHINDVVGMLSRSDIFVHPTYHEGFGLSLVEAEMCQLPIVASNVGSIPEIVENGVNGLVVPPKDSHALAIAIQRLIENKNMRESMGQSGRKIYLKKFRLDDLAKDHYMPLYRGKI